MNGPTQTGDSGECGGGTGGNELSNYFEPREIKNMVDQNADDIYRGAEQLVGSVSDRPQSGMVTVPLDVLSPVCKNETDEGEEITDHARANDIAKKILLGLYERFSPTNRTNIIRNPSEPNTYSWIDYFINADKKIQMVVTVTEPAPPGKNQKELFGTSAKAELAVADSIPARNLRRRILSSYKERAKRRHPTAIGPRGHE